MERLQKAERERLAAIDNLIRLGVVRSRVLVGDLGERIAADFYGVELAPAFTAGHDLVDPDGRRVQVKTLRGTPEGPRTIIGELRGEFDVLLAIRLNFDYTPSEAIEVPSQVAREFVGKNGKVGWTNALAHDDRVRWIRAEELPSWAR